MRCAFLIALAIVALSLQAIRPICEILLVTSGSAVDVLSAVRVADMPAHSAHGLDGTDLCCASIEEVAAPSSLAVMPAPPPSGTSLALPATFMLLTGAGLLPLATPRFGAPLLGARRYHTRSTRILR